jgi:Fe2+ or Zn2+ uptake regulation protein
MIKVISRRHRSTKQRTLILEELRKLTSHPSADEIYNIVRRKMPHISMGTVYRNLEILWQEGMIQKLLVGGTQKRFDGNVANHYHIRCIRCNRVVDAPVIPIDKLEADINFNTGFKILGHHLEFLGICPECDAENPYETRDEAHHDS